MYCLCVRVYVHFASQNLLLVSILALGSVGEASDQSNVRRVITPFLMHSEGQGVAQ